MYDDNDPDWLETVLCGLHEIDDDGDPLPVVEGPSPTGKPLKGFPPVLDIFARLLTYAEKSQVTVVAFRPTSAAHPAGFVVAQTTGVTDDVVNHVLYLVAHLRRVRELYPREGTVQSRSVEEQGIMRRERAKRGCG
ncbi:hypothetical protein OH76DRAFT_1409642 [Lentinus brumalis]|uniref:Uncharacterized protein n=1 Tax=Lentinus brumalis TaxID=2498619 RepID=A0A371CU67_9APHY|nr:hypothetical protein OH76DRAFT_1409642 [Polyporus brumalis]